jgi:hydrogenase nickel incorporation protein HypA/HybF
MHERSLVKALLRQVEGVAASHPGNRVSSVRVRLGELSGVEPELFSYAFEELVAHSPLDGAVLNLELAALEGSCDECGNRFQIERLRFQCIQCGSSRVTLRGGEEMLLESVTLEEAEP